MLLKQQGRDHFLLMEIAWDRVHLELAVHVTHERRPVTAEMAEQLSQLKGQSGDHLATKQPS